MGVKPDLDFNWLDLRVNELTAQGDGMRNSAALLPESVNVGVRLFVLAGETGAIYPLPWYQSASSKWAAPGRCNVQLHSAPAF